MALMGQALFDANEATIQAALSQLAFNQSVFIQQTGIIAYRGKTTPFSANLSWAVDLSGTNPITRLELQEIQNNVLVRRIVGDGENLWTYDLVEHTYSATNYGGYASSRPDGYQQNLLNYLSASARGQSSYVAKLLRQTFNQSSPYSSWAPGTRCTALVQDQVTYDPINVGATYLPTISDWFYMYDVSPKRSIVFEIVPQSQGNNSSPVNQLQNIFLNQVESVGKYPRFTHWQITPYTGVNFASSVFTPYSGIQIQGWKGVTGPKPVSN